MKDKINQKGKKLPNIMDTAARRLSYGDRSEKDMEKYLIDKGFDEKSVAEAICELKLIGYLDDHRYSLSFFRYAAGKGWAKSRTIRELKKKGVLPEVIEDAYSEYAEEHEGVEEDMAMEVVRKIITKDMLDESGKLPEKYKGRAARRLFSYGYNTSTIYSAINNVVAELNQ